MKLPPDELIVDTSFKNKKPTMKRGALFLVIFVVSIVFLTFLAISKISASTIFEDNFETYTLTNLNGQGGWFSNYAVATDTQHYSGNQSAFANSGYAYKDGLANSSGTLSISYLENDCGNTEIKLHGAPVLGATLIRLKTFATSGVCVIFLNDETSTRWGAVATGTWQVVSFSWNATSTYQIKFATSSFSNWITAPVYAGNEGFAPLEIAFLSGGSGTYYDYISEVANLISCADFQTFSTCEYNIFTNCSWSGTLATGTCGYFSAPTATTSDFLTYYNENSSFATPTALILQLKDFVAPMVESLHAFLTGFDEIFDLQKATEKGAEFGSAIPQARGYLAVINDFFNGFPVAEIFIFIILATLVVIVIRVSRTILQAIKFW